MRLGLRKSIQRIAAAIAVAATLGTMVPPNALAQADDGPPIIPNFWDPGVRSPAAAPSIEGIRFITSDDFPPFNFTAADGRLIGFNVDLARAICERLDIPCTIQVRPFEDLVGSLLEDRGDAAIAGVAMNEANLGAVLFSDVYLRFPARFVVRRSLPIDVSPETLDGRRVAVVAGTAHQAYLTAFFPDAIAVPFTTPELARTALRSGQTDALFDDGMELSFWLTGTTAGECCEFAGGPYLADRFFGRGMAIAVRPERPDIAAAINAAMRDVYNDGTYAALFVRYFPLSFY